VLHQALFYRNIFGGGAIPPPNRGANDAEGAELSGEWENCVPSQPTRGSGAASSAPPVECGAEPRPETHFGVFWRPQNAPFLHVYA